LIQQALATIFLSDNRKIRRSDQYQSLSTFSSGAEQSTHEFTSPGLYALDDVELAGAAFIDVEIEKTSYLILLAVTGDLIYTDAVGKKAWINVGELKIISLPASSGIRLTNPFPNDIINFLQICISADRQMNQNINALFNFDLNKKQNDLKEMYPLFAPFSISIGRFKGRKEGIYPVRSKKSRLFAFIITGAFEFENRLLHMRDGLEVSGIEEAQFEALSEGAILLLIERFI